MNCQSNCDNQNTCCVQQCTQPDQPSQMWRPTCACLQLCQNQHNFCLAGCDNNQ